MHDAVEAQVAQDVREVLVAFLHRLLTQLDAQIDRRLVRTFARTIDAILCFRSRAHGLLLSELGAYLYDPAHAPAGTKRLSNLLRCSTWSSQLIEEFLWQQATAELAVLEEQGEEALVLWDESHPQAGTREKPESLADPDLGSVRSSKAHRLTRIKPGFYRPPSRPIFVPGFQWIGLLLAGMHRSPTLAALHWWTNRGERKSDKRSEEATLLQQTIRRWGQRVCHVFDQGFAGTPWLSLLFAHQIRFILRWPGRYKLADVAGNEQNAWQLARGKRAWDHRLLSRCAPALLLQDRGPGHPGPVRLPLAGPGGGTPRIGAASLVPAHQ